MVSSLASWAEESRAKHFFAEDARFLVETMRATGAEAEELRQANRVARECAEWRILDLQRQIDAAEAT